MGQIIQVVRLPIFWSFIGPEGVAMWLLGFQVMGFIAFYNIGFDNAYLNYTAQYNAKGEYKRLSELLSTGVTIAFVLGGIIFAILYFASDRITVLMMNETTSPRNMATFRYIIIVIAATNWYKMVAGVQRSMLSGAQRMDLMVYLGLILTPIELGAMVGAMYLGYGVDTLITIYAVFMALPPVFIYAINRRILPEVRVNPFKARLDCVRPLFSLGGRMQLLGLVAIVVNTLDNLVMNKFYGLEFMGSYGTARQLSQRAQGVVRQGLGALVPASADLHTREDHQKLSGLYMSATRVTLLVTAFIFAFVGVNGDYILMIFMDAENYTTIALQFIVFLSVARIFHTITGPGSTMLRGAGKPRDEISYQSLQGVLFLIFFVMVEIYLAVGFTHNFVLPPVTMGGVGAQLESAMYWDKDYTALLLTFPLSLILSSQVFVMFANRYFQAPLWTPFDKTLVPSFIALFLAVGLRLGWNTIPESAFAFLPFDWDFSRWPSVISVGTQGAVYCALFGIAMLLVPGLSRREKMQVLRLIPGGKRILGPWVR